MKKETPSIFLIYANADKHSADEIDNDFRKLGILITEVNAGMQYKPINSNFNQLASNADYVMMFISDHFLKNQQCMLQATELLIGRSFDAHILPVLSDEINLIHKLENRVAYYTYWKSELAAITALSTNQPNEDFLREQRVTEIININLGDFFNRLTTTKTKTLDELKAENFKSVIQVIGLENEHLLYELFRIDNIKNIELKEAALDKFIRTNPKYARAWFYKGFLASETGQKDKAMAYYQAAVGLDPLLDLAHYNLAVLMFTHKKDYDSTKKHLTLALKANPTSLEALNTMATLLLEQYKDYNGANTYLKKLVALDPLNFSNWNHLGVSQFRLRQFESARDSYLKSLELESTNIIAHMNLAIILERQFNDFDGALYHLDKVIETDPNFAQAYHLLTVFGLRNFPKDQLPQLFPYIEGWYYKAITLDPTLAEPELNFLFGIEN